MTPSIHPPILNPIVKTTLRLIASSALFLAVECLVDCSGLDKLADYYEFLDRQQETIVQSNTEKQISKAIGKLFIPTQIFQAI
jgi:hypothetical protein